MFRLLRRMLILSGDGRVVYTGQTEGAPAHFASLGLSVPPQHELVADFALDAVIRSSDATVDKWVGAYQVSEACEDEHVRREDLESFRSGDRFATVPRKYMAGFITQLRVLCGRRMRNVMRHPLVLTLCVGVNAVMALAIGLIYRDIGKNTFGIFDRMGCLFFLLIFLSVISLSSLPLWSEERLLFYRERASGVYGTRAYFASVLLLDVLPMRILPPVFFVFTYWLAGLREGDGHLGNFAAVIVLSNACASAMCMMLGAATDSTAVANVIGSLVTLFMLLFGGLFLNRGDVPPSCQWAADLSYVNYAFEALMINEFHNATGFYLDSVFNKAVHIDVADGSEILTTLSFGTTLERYRFDVAVLGGMTVVYLLLTFMLLKRRSL